jgi:hypothetical protein
MGLRAPVDNTEIAPRAAQSSRDLHNIIGELQERGCGFVSLGDSWCDTTLY